MGTNLSLFEVAAKIHIASRGSPGTRELYTADLARWLLFCQLGGYDVDAPTLTVAVAFRDDLMSKLADQTVRRILSAISSMYDAAGILNVFKSSKRLPRPVADDVVVTKEFSPEEIVKIFVAAENLLLEGNESQRKMAARDLAIMKILYDTGMRVTSVVSLQRGHTYVRADGQPVIVTKVKKKGRVEIELPPTSAHALERWSGITSELSKYVFPAARGGGHLTRRAISRRMLTYGKLAGVADAAPHRFRATFATEALDAGIPLSEVQAAMHHADPKMTQRYDRRLRGTGVTAAVAKHRRGE